MNRQRTEFLKKGDDRKSSAKADTEKAAAEKEGLVHMYFGDGKGKTTAAVGLAARAAGRGRRVLFAQFLKGRKTGELNSIKKFDARVIRSEKSKRFCWEMTDEEIAECRMIQAELLDEIKEIIHGAEQIDLLVLDESLNAAERGLLDEDALRDFIMQKPRGLEIVLTGRTAPEWLMERADYITEMKKHKHPFDKGVDGRMAIEF